MHQGVHWDWGWGGGVSISFRSCRAWRVESSRSALQSASTASDCEFVCALS